jgi:hypothetical protein
MLKFDDGDGLPTHVLDGVLVAEPIGSLYRVVHVPLPTVLAEIAKARCYSALRGDRVTACREYFGDARGGEPGLDGPLGGTQTRPTCSHHNDIEDVIDKFVCKSRTHYLYPWVKLERLSSTPHTRHRSQLLRKLSC